MILGIGTDIIEVSRFRKWLLNDYMIKRFFNEKEIIKTGDIEALCRHYAARFTAKEAFSKALGTGIFALNTKEVYVENKETGEPVLKVIGGAKEILDRKGGSNVFLSISHEKQYALSFVLIEKAY